MLADEGKLCRRREKRREEREREREGESQGRRRSEGYISRLTTLRPLEREEKK